MMDDYLLSDADDYAAHLIRSTEGVTFPGTVDPSVPYSAKVHAMPEPHRMTTRSTYCFTFDATVPMEILRQAALLRERCGEPYSVEAAAVSVMMDRDKGAKKRKADYRRIWGWTEQQQRSRWEEIEQRIANWTTAYGRLSGTDSTNGAPTDEQRTSNGKQGDSKAESQNSNGAPTDEQRTSNGHTSSTPNSQEEESSSSSSTRARGGHRGSEWGGGSRSGSDDEYNPYLLGNGWPTEEQVRAWAGAHTKIPPDDAWEIAQSLNNIGWIDRDGRPYRQWDITITAGWKKRQQNEKQSAGTSNGSHQQASASSNGPGQSGKPQSDYHRRRDFASRPFDAEAYERLGESLRAARDGHPVDGD